MLPHDRFFRFLEGCAPAQPKKIGSPEGSPFQSAHREIRPPSVHSGGSCSRTTEKFFRLTRGSPSKTDFRLIRRFALPVDNFFRLTGRVRLSPNRKIFWLTSHLTPHTPHFALNFGSPEGSPSRMNFCFAFRMVVFPHKSRLILAVKEVSPQVSGSVSNLSQNPDRLKGDNAQ